MWYPDGDKIIRSEYNPTTAYALTPGREFLFRVSYLGIYNKMIESSVHNDEYDGMIFSQLNLINLAGLKSSKTETTGLRRKEGSYINRSLLTLGTVIGKLSEGKASHIPYRDSKLTRLLQSSLSGRGHVSLIRTVIPASSSTEETHNTLKFPSKAKRVEIYASRNKIVDEKSLIKKYQREISSLKQELDQVRRGMLVGISHEEIMSLREQVGVHYGLFANFRSVGCGGTYLGSDIQKFISRDQEGQVKMQSRLEEEEEAKATLMSRIQRLTKLILVSTKNAIPGYLGEVLGHQRSHSAGEDDILEVFQDSSLHVEIENHKDSPSSAECMLLLYFTAAPSVCTYYMLTPLQRTKDFNFVFYCIANIYEAFDVTFDDEMTMSNEIDLLVEQVKMLAGDIAFSTSTLKCLLEQSVNDPDVLKSQIQNLECAIQEKRRQMRILE
ncbi:hypothetical protein Ancab_013770 [Ancistrocladus abbreviatus]